MRSGAAAGTLGYFHETAFYNSDHAFVALATPFVLDGVAAGEPTLVACHDHNRALIENALASTAPDALRSITFLPVADQYARPAKTIRSYRAKLRELVHGGATQVRVIGDVPHPGLGEKWDPWARYEAAVNEAFDDFPIWGMCPYDTRITPPDVLDEVLLTHQHIATIDGAHQPNEAFMDPRSFLGRRTNREHWSPTRPADLELNRATPRQVRAALNDLCERAAIDDVTAADLVAAASEIVTNAIAHGRPPHNVRAWIGHGPPTVTVTDAGTGPQDAMLGMIPPSRAPGAGGHGLWIASQLCRDLVMASEPDGFTVRLTM